MTNSNVKIVLLERGTQTNVVANGAFKDNRVFSLAKSLSRYVQRNVERQRRTVLLVTIAMTVLTACGGGSSSTTESPIVDMKLPDEIPGELTDNRDEVEPVPVSSTEAEPAPVGSPDVHNTVFIPNDTDIVDNPDVYSQDGYADVDIVRIDLKTNTVEGSCQPGDQSGCTLDDVLADIDAGDNFKVDIPVHFMASDFADDGSMNNAELRQRGGGARFAPQKSFRLRLDDKNVLWRSERHLLLNKHPFESSRIRNKLSFDLMSGIPHLPSFRTQFVNLWIDDGAGPVDQGLYTHVERGDQRYLKRHGLDDDAKLYQATFFRFRESDRNTLLIDDEGEPLNKNIFETVLEIENGKDHRNLIAMLEALHDPEQSFESVMERFFNENNVLTWVTVNLLLAQQDITRHNFFLYNPEDSETFYFLPWDYDMTFQPHNQPNNDLTAESLQARLDFGYAAGAESDFLKNYYSRPGIHERILEAADELRESYLDDTTIAERAQLLSAAVAPYASVQPDITFNEHYSENSSSQFDDIVAFNHDALTNHFGIPLPPTLLEPELRNSQWQFAWQRALEVTGSAVSYRLQLATSAAFQADEIVAEFEGIEGEAAVIEYQVDPTIFRSGVHYARLFALPENDPENNWQIADNVLELNDSIHYGVVTFTVE